MDVGSGTGILSIFCAFAGAKRVCSLDQYFNFGFAYISFFTKLANRIEVTELVG